MVWTSAIRLKQMETLKEEIFEFKRFGEDAIIIIVIAKLRYVCT